ncbi:MAG: hypothetical protein Q8Q91_00480 [Candidatus Daviesbacteria bacterium]|nr:hypothetical protein [Candidatus Daviesbacteria bacterium]
MGSAIVVGDADALIALTLEKDPHHRKAVSKHNTFFDAIVAATAEKLNADGIFSFDSWYPKLGFKLVDKNFPD